MGANRQSCRAPPGRRPRVRSARLTPSRPVDPRLVRALTRQLDVRRAALEAGAEHVGWKLGMGAAESIGGEIAVGHLTSATRLAPSAAYESSGSVDLRADAEVAVELARDIDPGRDAVAARTAAAGYAAALEIVDLGPPSEAEDVVAANVFHRAFALGAAGHPLPDGAVVGALVVNGEVRARAPSEDELGGRLMAAARVLAAVGERLRAGDRVITGSVVQVAVSPGDRVVADLGPLGAVALEIASA